jgi:hypothetical protein
VVVKKPIFIEQSHYTNVRFYFKRDKELKLEDISNSNLKDKIQVKKYEADDIFYR